MSCPKYNFVNVHFKINKAGLMEIKSGEIQGIHIKSHRGPQSQI